MTQLVDTLAQPVRYGWGIDWLTLTWAAGTEMYQRVKRYPHKLLHELDGTPEGQGSVENVKRLGYAGWRLNKWYIGWRPDSCILIVTSYAAQQIMQIPHLDEARCTRIDIKADLHYEYPRPYILDNAYHLSALAQKGIRGRKWNLELHQPSERPHWLQIGCRGAGIYLRIYDKWEESGRDPAYEGVWRVEAELAKECANEAFHWIVSRRGTVNAVRDVGLAMFARRGIRLAGVRPAEWFTVEQLPRRNSDVDRRMAWLRKLVRPAIRKLLTEVSQTEIMDALELFQKDYESEADDGERDRWKYNRENGTPRCKACEETFGSGGAPAGWHGPGGCGAGVDG